MCSHPSFAARFLARVDFPEAMPPCRPMTSLPGRFVEARVEAARRREEALRKNGYAKGIVVSRRRGRKGASIICVRFG